MRKAATAQPLLSAGDGGRKSDPVLWVMPEQRGHVFCVASAGRLKTRWQSRQANFVSGRVMGSGYNLFRVNSETAETDASLQVSL
jgi:hypothetical protein